MSEKNLFKTQIRIRRYVSLLISDEFNHWVLEQRRLEQSKNKPKPQKWSNLHVTRTEIWLSSAVWWPGSVIRSIQLMEVRGLVTFHAVPSLLAMGIQSRFNPSNKQYVVMLLPSGKHRDKLIQLLQPLCDPQHRVSQCDIQTDLGQGASTSGYRLSDTSRIELGLYRGEDIGSSWSMSTDPTSSARRGNESVLVEIQKPTVSALQPTPATPPRLPSPPTKTVPNPSISSVDKVKPVVMPRAFQEQPLIKSASPKISTVRPVLTPPVPSPSSSRTASRSSGAATPNPISVKATVSSLESKRVDSPEIPVKSAEEYHPGIDEDQLTYVCYHPKLGMVICDRGPVYLYCEHFLPGRKI